MKGCASEGSAAWMALAPTGAADAPPVAAGAAVVLLVPPDADGPPRRLPPHAATINANGRMSAPAGWRFE